MSLTSTDRLRADIQVIGATDGQTRGCAAGSTALSKKIVKLQLLLAVPSILPFDRNTHFGIDKGMVEAGAGQDRRFQSHSMGEYQVYAAFSSNGVRSGEGVEAIFFSCLCQRCALDWREVIPWTCREALRKEKLTTRLEAVSRMYDWNAFDTVCKIFWRCNGKGKSKELTGWLVRGRRYMVASCYCNAKYRP
jgi:hypothetical protein